MSQAGTGVEHEKASMMRQYFDIVRNYDPTGKTPYLDRVHSLLSFTPNPVADISSRTSGLYLALNSTSHASYSPISSNPIEYKPRESFSYKGLDPQSSSYLC